MTRIFIFAGTTEGRILSDILAQNKLHHTIFVATDYGKDLIEKSEYTDAFAGRLDEQDIESLIRMEKEKYKDADILVIDATHPFAKIVTNNIKTASENIGKKVKYIRLKRDVNIEIAGKETAPNDGRANSIKISSNDISPANIFSYDTIENLIEDLKKSSGNILLTTGSKDLPKFAAINDIRDRLYVRVIPSIESLEICDKCGIAKKNIIAMQGPFNEDMNISLIRQFDIKNLVTKQSGAEGGYIEKVTSAKKTNINLYELKADVTDEGFGLAEVLDILEDKLGTKISHECTLSITFAGAGPGDANFRSYALYKAIQSADIIIGADRLIKDIKGVPEKKHCYLSKDIIPYLKRKLKKLKKDTNILVLLSGDISFYSGYTKLYADIKREFGDLTNIKLSEIPGITSISYMAAKMNVPYSKAKLFSTHGNKNNWDGELVDIIKHNENTYLLLSGKDDIKRIGKILNTYFFKNKYYIRNNNDDINTEESAKNKENISLDNANNYIKKILSDGEDVCMDKEDANTGKTSGIRIFIGKNLSYDSEEIFEITPDDMENLNEDAIYVCLIQNHDFEKKKYSFGIDDDKFIRDKVPMTKSEIRSVIMSKLCPQDGDIFWDIGAGTGSVSIEYANAFGTTRVYAIEKEEKAVELIKKNKQKFALPNIEAINTKAPNGLYDIPLADKVFIGGSSRMAMEIVELLKERMKQENKKKIRVVASSVTLETTIQFAKIISNFDYVCNEQILSMQVNRAEYVGSCNSHIFKSQNEIKIFAFDIVETSDN